MALRKEAKSRNTAENVWGKRKKNRSNNRTTSRRVKKTNLSGLSVCALMRYCCCGCLFTRLSSHTRPHRYIFASYSVSLSALCAEKKHTKTKPNCNRTVGISWSHSPAKRIYEYRSNVSAVVAMSMALSVAWMWRKSDQSTRLHKHTQTFHPISGLLLIWWFYEPIFCIFCLFVTTIRA